MREKINSKSGFTLVEMLAAVAVLMLLTMMLGTGIQMALNSYRTMIAQAEVELLVSTAVDALADDLRFARDVKADPVSKKLTSYTSDSFGENTELALGETGSDNEGQIMASGKRFLSTGAYGAKVDGNKRAYRITDMTIKYNEAKNTFNIQLTVKTADEKISAGTPKNEDGEDIGVTVRCLNPAK